MFFSNAKLKCILRRSQLVSKYTFFRFLLYIYLLGFLNGGGRNPQPLSYTHAPEHDCSMLIVDVVRVRARHLLIIARAVKFRV